MKYIDQSRSQKNIIYRKEKMNKKKKTGKTKETLENSYLFDNNRDDTNILKHILFYFLQKHMKNLGK